MPDINRGQAGHQPQEDRYDNVGGGGPAEQMATMQRRMDDMSNHMEQMGRALLGEETARLNSEAKVK